MRRTALVLSICSLTAAAVAGDAMLVLGPLPDVAPVVADAGGASSAEFVPELDPTTLWPRDGDRVQWSAGDVSAAWTEVPGGDDHEVAASSGRAVCWAASYVTLDRYAKLTVRAGGAGDLRLYLDGSQVASGSDSVEHTASTRAGMHRLLVRLACPGDQRGALSITSEVEEPARAVSGTDPRHALTDYDDVRDWTTISGLLLSPDGALVAYGHSDRAEDGGSWSRLRVLECDSGAVRAEPGGASARAVAWSPDGSRLLFRDGSSLYTWSRDNGALSRVLDDEPGLGDVSWSSDGRWLVFSSTRGTSAPPSGNARRLELREKLSDWPTRPHLHLLAVESGARRRLMSPGDWVQDAFAILPDNRTLFYLRSVPIERRPWFATEFRALDLPTGEDRLIQRVTMGFENRPGLSGMAVSPDGRRAAFIGPPSTLGDDVAVEPNAFDPDLFVIDIADGRWFCASAALSASVSGHLTWSADSSSIYFVGSAGSRDVLFDAMLFDREDAEPEVMFGTVPIEGEVIHELSVSASGRVAAVTSRVDRLPALYLGSIGGVGGDPWLDPNLPLQRRLELAAASDASFPLADGTPVEGWLLRPDASTFASDEKLPLIVYYYGGATPTKRGFNELHQFLVGNGYALYVVNPRGAAGYGREFADHHAADWGEKAGADIIAGVENVLRRNADLDPDRVGCYGGSYGGFMTMYLLTRTARFAAAVAMYGISNLASYYGDGMWGYTYGDQAMARKYPWSDPAWYTRQSPLFAADRVHTPLLLLHGDKDGNVPVGESEQMFTALRLLGREVEYVRFAGEDHGLRGTWDNRVAHRTMMLEWFDRYLRGRPDAWSARWK